MSLETLVRSFRHRNYRLYCTGQIVSLVGTWMQSLAQSWLVYRLTGSSLALGVVGFAAQIPIFVLALFGGVLADRLPKRSILVATQTASLVQAVLLSVLTFSGLVQVWHVIALAVLLGVVNAVDIPTRHSFVVDMVGKEDLGNAIALNSSMFHVARVVGPALAGILVALVGEAWCFAINAVSFLAVIASFLAMRLDRPALPPSSGSVAEQLKEVVLYAYQTPRIRAVLMLIALSGLMGVSYMVLLPVFAGQVFGRGAEGLGLLTGSVGVGSLVGALLMANRGGAQGLARVARWSCAGLGAALILFAQAPSFWAGVVLVAPAGFALLLFLPSCNTMLQLGVPDALRGRIMSLYSMLFMGMSPFGALLAGALAEWVGPQRAVVVMGACCLAGALTLGRAIGKE